VETSYLFWFWLRLLITSLIIVWDVIWWAAAMRMAKGTRWRIPLTVVMAVLLLVIVGSWLRVDVTRYTSKALLVAFVIWHLVGLAVLPPLGLLRACAWMARAIGVRRNPPATASHGANTLTRRGFLGVCAVLAPPLITVGVTGVALAQLNSFRVRRFILSVPTLPRALDGVTIAHVSDIHVGNLTNGPVLRAMVNATNALRADLVLLTGDLINHDLSDLDEGIALVKAMQGRYGQWMIEGNHDLFVNGAEFERRVRAAGIPFLANESAVAEVRGYPVQFLGLRWVGGGNVRQCDQITAGWLRELMRHRQPDAFPILLAHHPHAFDAAAEAALPLTLSGHTHGGVLMLDSRHGFGPAFFRYWSGLYARGGSQLIVSNGVGNWFPLRVNAPAEIIHITLRGTGTVS
jgi:predicted MPP superfamily phosphohydrolase